MTEHLGPNPLYPHDERRASRGWMFLIVLASIAILAGLTWAACLLVVG